MIPDSLVAETRSDIEEALVTAGGMADTEGDPSANAWLKRELAMPSEEDMLSRVDRLYDRFSGGLSPFGLTRDDVRTAYTDSGMHESLAEWREGEVSAFRKEHRAEFSAERRIR